jgi:hypothetical protein
MVAGRGGYQAVLQQFRRLVDEEIKGAADLEGSGPLEVFAFEEQWVAQSL